MDLIRKRQKECLLLSEELIKEVGIEKFNRELQKRTKQLVEDLNENSTNWYWEPNTQEPEKDVVFRLMDHIGFQMVREIQLTGTLQRDVPVGKSKGFKN